MSRARRTRVAFALIFGASVAGAIVVAASWGDDAEAQQPRVPPHRPRPAAPKRDAGPSPETTLDAGAPPLAPARPETPTTTASTDAGLIESRQLDGGNQIFRFGNIEIEGQLKSPQLVYFLRRVRAEFAAGDLGHRSFLRELSETRKGPSF